LILISLYLIIDNVLYKRESVSISEKNSEETVPLRIEGLINLVFLAGVIGAVILSGVLNKNPMFIDPLTGEALGITLFHYQGHELVWTWVNLIRDAFILLMAGLSLKFTSLKLRQDNFFTWAPMREVAVLFAGIFTTMVPALEILKARGGELGVTTPAQFFMATGALSSFLDNAPTYLTFLSLAGGLGSETGVFTDLGTVDTLVLAAISSGAVFMGANTYIGNAPNFMVRSIAEENGVKMPSFFGYMGWSVLILIPIFILDMLLFF
jgi:Na+/H+ antiporter NhaD/arsenite permease-like protein